MTIMEIRFCCPICPEQLYSLASTKQHITTEHKKAWKCFQCPTLFSLLENARMHVEESHPTNSESSVENADVSFQTVGDLKQIFKKIKLIRFKRILVSSKSDQVSGKQTIWLKSQAIIFNFGSVLLIDETD